MWKDFRDFVMRGNVIDLAVGIVIGAAFNSVVNSFVNDIVMAPLGALLGKVDFSQYYINLSSGSYDSLAAAQEAGAPTINYGLFIGNLISFVIVALAVFLLVKGIQQAREAIPKHGEAEGEKKDEVKTKECPYCYTLIPIKATRCPNCTTQLETT